MESILNLLRNLCRGRRKAVQLMQRIAGSKEEWQRN